MNIFEIEQKLKNKEYLTEEEIDFFLSYTCNYVCNIVNHPTYENTCDTIQGIVGRYFNKLGIKINPCITNKCISPYVNGHSFIVATFQNGEHYLIDPSFIQFLILDNYYEDLYINHFKVKAKSPFYYAKQINEKLLLKFLKNGFHKLTPEFIFMYGNAFYKTSTNISDTTILEDIPSQVLLSNFLNGKEELRDYGYQDIPLSYSKSK